MFKLIKDKKELMIVVIVTFLITTLFSSPLLIGLIITTNFPMTSVIIILIGYLVISTLFWLVNFKNLK